MYAARTVLTRGTNETVDIAFAGNALFTGTQWEANPVPYQCLIDHNLVFRLESRLGITKTGTDNSTRQRPR